MKKLSVGQQRLIAEFLSNIGVAWFVAGVISVFPSWPKNWSEAAISFLWGAFFSLGFLRTGLFFVKGVKS
ncbi:MAG: hypothetical protein ACOZBZ_02400 [Patescibacteria group bacterium]